MEEKGADQEWIEEAGLWELSDPSTPTYRAGAVADGVRLALGVYRPEGILPQAADPETDGGNPDVHPLFVSEDLVMANRHALFLDLLTTEAEIFRQPKNTPSTVLQEKSGQKKNSFLEQDKTFQRLAKLAKTERNILQQLEQLLASLARTFRDCYRKVRTNNEWTCSPST